MNNYVCEFLDYLKILKKHSDNTIKSYQIDILSFLNYNNNSLEIDSFIVNNYLLYLNEQELSKSTISRKLSALRTFYNYLEKKEIIANNYFNQIKNPKKEASLPKYVKENDIDKMFTIPNQNEPLGMRNLTIIRLLYSTGLRVSELVNIKLKDINLSEHTIKVLGKGSKERIVVFGNHSYEALKKYINTSRYFLNTKNNDYLFLNKDGNRLSDRYIRIIINEIIRKSSIDMHVSPHMLRHTFATHMLANGCDLVSVKDLLGHESLSTTSIYTHLSNERLKEVYNNAHPRA